MEQRRRGRPVTFDHKHVPHYCIAMPRERSAALERMASSLGVSRHVLIQRFITFGLAVFDEDE